MNIAHLQFRGPYLRLMLVVLSCLATTLMIGQSTDLIVKWGGKPADLAQEPQQRKWLAQDMGIELLSYTEKRSADRAAAYLRQHPLALHVQYDTEVSFRATPDDALYVEQSNNLARTGFPEAWELTTGGKTPNGDDIVVAVLDAGFQINHRDLANNVWRNPYEIADDGIDNDNNGYTDDTHGWDLVTDSKRIAGSTHGTQVIGTLGAVGNNDEGIAGTNWDTKMMLLRISTESQIIAAYEYVRQQRKRWNETGGREGAFVVATNASFGVEGGTCSQYPMWGEMYDALGKEGILTAAAVANRNWDIDFNGDMPTDCPSNYLIGVANVDELDRLYRMSGFGRMNVDLAAPGEGSYSTLPGNQYGSFGNTSAAAPYVTGAIALLYATPCPQFHQQVRSDPETAALLVRDVLLSGVRSLPSIRFRTSSGGLLNVATSQSLLMGVCEEGPELGLEITKLTPNPASDQVTITLNTLVVSEGATVSIFDGSGRMIRRQLLTRIGGGQARLSFSVADLPIGYYQLLVTERERSAATKLIVSR